jgi:hypothetical protein
LLGDDAPLHLESRIQLGQPLGDPEKSWTVSHTIGTLKECRKPFRVLNFCKNS